jgi:uncharacterized membrane protein
MEVLIINFKWMAFNAFLAFVPVFIGIYLHKVKDLFIKLLLAFMWLLFLPNTIYLLSDPINILGDLRKLSGIYLAIDLIFYLLLILIGVISYVVAVNLFMKAFFKLKDRIYNLVILMINFLLGFGMILGRIERINSWEAFTQTARVVSTSFKILFSPELMLFVLIWTSVAEMVYLILRKPIIKWIASR